jgi:hypothetical protein
MSILEGEAQLQVERQMQLLVIGKVPMLLQLQVELQMQLLVECHAGRPLQLLVEWEAVGVLVE